MLAELIRSNAVDKRWAEERTAGAGRLQPRQDLGLRSGASGCRIFPWFGGRRAMGLANARQSRGRCGAKRATVLALTVLIAAMTASEAMAIGVWDPNDARGGLDMRWVGVHYPRAGRAQLTVAFHGFPHERSSLSALP